MSVGQHYRGDAGRRYFARQRKAGEIGATLNLRFFVDHIPPEASLVDFGCGGGCMLMELAAREKLGIEPNNEARRAALKRGLRVVGSPAEVEEGFADVVISSHALEHSLAPFHELRELLRILKPGGKLVLLLPLDDWRSQRRLALDDVDHHLYAWTPLLLSNLLTEAGFAVQAINVVTRAWPPGVKLLRRLPLPLLEGLSWVWSVADRRRQLHAVAIKPASHGGASLGA